MSCQHIFRLLDSSRHWVKANKTFYGKDEIQYATNSQHDIHGSKILMNLDCNFSSCTTSENWTNHAKQILQKHDLRKGLGGHLTDLIICSEGRSHKPYELVLSTSMYHDKVKQPIFKTVINLWSHLLPEVLSVLYINDLQFVTDSGDLLQLACTKGWVVAVTPKAIQTGYPLINTMFEYSIQNFQAHWYGLSNGDILHTDRLWRILKHLRESPVLTSNPKIPFATSRKYNHLVSHMKLIL